MFKSSSFLILSISLIIFSFTLFPQGMFLDGITYAVISRNLAEGLGSIWKPFYTLSLSPEFYGHPPLAIFFQSIFFEIFGDYTWVERIYSLTSFIIQFFLIQVIWRLVSPRKDMTWLPVLLWIVTGGVIWSYSNNLLENTNAIFISLTAYFSLKGFDSKKIKFHLFAGISLFLSVLTKGPFGLFILSLPTLYFIFHLRTSWKESIKATVIQTAVLSTLISILLLSSNEAFLFFKNYLNDQVLNSIQSIKTVSSRTYILIKFLKNTWYIILLGIYFAWKNSAPKKEALFFILVSQTGVLPIIISLKQSAFYIVPVYPFLAIGISLLICPCISFTETPLKSKLLKLSTLICLLSAVFLSIKNYSQFRRDEEIIKDVISINNLGLDSDKIKNETGLRSDFYMHAYFQRYASLSLSNLCTDCDYSLTKKSNYNKDEKIFNGVLFNLEHY